METSPFSQEITKLCLCCLGTCRCHVTPTRLCISLRTWLSWNAMKCRRCLCATNTHVRRSITNCKLLTHLWSFSSEEDSKTNKYHFRIRNILLPAATKLGQGNIFTSVCQEFCTQGGSASASVHAGMQPPKQTPPWSRTPRTRHPPPEQTPPGPDTHPPPYHGSRHQHTVNERPVSILPECILVNANFNGIQSCSVYFH